MVANEERRLVAHVALTADRPPGISVFGCRKLDPTLSTRPPQGNRHSTPLILLNVRFGRLINVENFCQSTLLKILM